MPSYDEDRNDDRQRCVHGTFIGSWWGPDYLCGWCEDGISVDDMHRIQAEAIARKAQRKEDTYEAMRAVLAQHPYEARVATALVTWVLSST